MQFDGSRGRAVAFGDLFVGFAFDDCLEHFTLARCERGIELLDGKCSDQQCVSRAITFNCTLNSH